MRMRRSKHVTQYLSEYPDLIIKPEDLSPEFFSVPVHLEIGMGKGDFLHQKASKYPLINFLGIDRNIMAISKSRLKFDELSNVKLIHESLQNLMDYLPEHQVDVIYLNFSDPWPKSGHYKRRLTYRDLLGHYEMLLSSEGEIHLKTDSKSLYEFTLEEVEHSHFQVINQTEDLWNDPIFKDHMPTEYERKFVARGQTIYGILLRLGGIT